MISTPDRRNVLELIREARANGARLQQACRTLGITERTYQRWTAPEEGVLEDRRPLTHHDNPNRLSETERQKILEVASSPEYASTPPAHIVHSLADHGIYLASESTFYRVLREANQQHHRGRSRTPRKRPPATTHRAEGPNQVWTWDITYLRGPVLGQHYYLYLILDIYSRKIVGWEVYDQERGELASEVVTRASLAERIGQARSPLVLHSDNGSPMKSATLRATLGNLGILHSHSRPRVSDDNAYSESLFKTLKYGPGFPEGGFSDLVEAREWVHQFVQWYNSSHRHSALNYVTPQQRHDGEAETVLRKRKELLEQAKRAHPNRWSNRPTRDCRIAPVVWLNPQREENPKPKEGLQGEKLA